MDFRKKALLAGFVALALVVHAGWLWQPERQVRRHQKDLLKTVERRSWERMKNFIADDYSDRWTHDKSTLLELTRLALQDFVFLTIENKVESVSVAGADRIARTHLKMSGAGGALAPIVIQKVNALREPFTFRWHRQSWKPWDWRLVSADHPTLHIDARDF